MTDESTFERTSCSACGKVVKYPPKYAGRKVACPKCSATFVLPRATPRPPLPPAGSPANPAAITPKGPTTPSAPPATASPAKTPQASPPAKPSPNAELQGLENKQPPTRTLQSRTTLSGPSGAKYTETSLVLSAIHGFYSSEQLGCDYVLSPDGWRVFHTGGRRGAIATFSNLISKEANFMLDGQVFQPEGFDGTAHGFRFSPDSKHYSYFTRSKQGVCLVIDETPVSDRFAKAFQPVLSHSAKDWAFAAQIGKKWHVVHNGQVGSAFDEILPKTLHMSTDGQFIGYIGVRARQKYTVIGDQEILTNEPSGTVVSEDGSHCAWVEKTKDGRRVIIDGEHEAAFDKIDEDSLCFSADGTHLAYSAKKLGKWHIVRDGKLSPPYAEIASKSLTFSPDGQRFAYAACTSKSLLAGRADWRVILDGVDQPVYASVDHLTFAPNSVRFAYAAGTKKGVHLVLDGTEQGRWEGISALIFSPDSQRHILLAQMRNGTKKCLVIDGKDGNLYKDVGQIGFSEDSRHVVAMALGDKYSEPTPSIWSGNTKREGGFLLLDNDYESNAWISSPGPSQYNRTLYTEVQIAFARPSTVYAVSLFIDNTEVSFRRVDVEWC